MATLTSGIVMDSVAGYMIDGEIHTSALTEEGFLVKVVSCVKSIEVEVTHILFYNMKKKNYTCKKLKNVSCEYDRVNG